MLTPLYYVQLVWKRSTLASPLHIVLLNYRDVTHPEAGGAEVYLQELFERVVARGHTVTLLCAGHRGAPAQESIGGVDVVRIANQATFNIAAPRAALRLARAQRVDLFVECLCKLPFLMPWLTRIPVLPMVLHLFGHTAFHEKNPLVASYVWLFEKLIPVVYRDTPFVALSDSTAADLRRRGVRTPAMHVVPPGLDLTRYTPGDPPRPDEPLVVYVGRLKRYKGLDFVLEAFARVRRTLTDARFVLVGKGDDRERLEARATGLGLGDAVRFTGFVSEDDKIAWLRHATTVVYPSPREGWGLSTIEAAACGTPVIASDSEGLRDAVRPGQTGFLVPHRDVAAWAARITDVLTDHALRERMAAAGRAWAMQFDWDAGAAQLCQIVEGLASRNGRAPA